MKFKHIGKSASEKPAPESSNSAEVSPLTRRSFLRNSSSAGKEAKPSDRLIDPIKSCRELTARIALEQLAQCKVTMDDPAAPAHEFDGGLHPVDPFEQRISLAKRALERLDPTLKGREQHPQQVQPATAELSTGRALVKENDLRDRGGRR